MKPSSLIAFFALALSACESTPTIKTDVDPQAAFGQYKSYQWIEQAPPRGMNPLNYDRIRAAIEGQLAVKGYQIATNGDIAIAFSVGAKEKISVNDLGPYYGRWSRTEVSQYTEGTIAVDAFDVKTKRPIWHGVATQQIDESGAEADKIAGVVAAIMASFPART